jgi:hypothetical protein
VAKRQGKTRRRTKGRWPYRPRLLPDELLSSYIIRIAHGLLLKPTSFMNAMWGSHVPLIAKDLDEYAPDYIIDRVAEGVDQPREIVLAATLADFEGWLTVPHEFGSRKTWILPVRPFAYSRQRPGLQYCPVCLATDPKPYMRRAWRLAFSTCCTVHGVALRERCGHCGENLHPHRSSSLSRCYSCGKSLAGRTPECAPSASIVEQQQHFENIVQAGGTILNGRAIHSLLYFMIVRQIAALLVNGPRASAFRTSVTELFGGDGVEFERPTKRQPVEYLTIAQRYRLFDLIERVMRDFPSRFICVCERARMWRSRVIKDMTYVPFRLG